MNELIESLAISAILTLLKGLPKDPKKKAVVKRAVLKVRNAINAVYADDPDFNPEVNDAAG